MIVSAILFVVCAAGVALLPVPYVVWTPGATYDLLGADGGKPLVTVANAQTYATTGRLLLTTVGVSAPTARVTLIAALAAYWSSSGDALPQAAVYPPNVDSGTLLTQQTAQMGASQEDAVVAAVHTAGLPVSELPMVTAVSPSGASAGLLQPGDLVTFVDHTQVKTLQQAQDAITSPSRHVGDKVTLTFLRDAKTLQQTIITKASSSAPNVPTIGVDMAMGYTYTPRVSFAVDPAIGGSSGGLMFSLAVLDKLTSDDVAHGRVVAGTGTVAADGTVGDIGGVNEKIAASVRDGATVFVLPRSNCADVVRRPDIDILAVSTLAQAVQALDAPAGTQDPAFTCP